MTWTEIIKSVIAGTGVEVDVHRLITLIERASTGVDEPEDMDGIYDRTTQRVPFLDALERELKEHHHAWDPALLGEVRAVLGTLPRMLDRIRIYEKGEVRRRRIIHDSLEQLEEDAQIIEAFQPGRPQCPRCGSQRIDSQKTTALGTYLYERLCFACGYSEVWEDDVLIWPAPSSEDSKD